MKSTSSEIVKSSGLLYSLTYTLLTSRSDQNIWDKVKRRNPDIEVDNSCVLCDVTGCYSDVKVNQMYDLIFESENIEKYEDTLCIVKNVFALGYKSIDEIPSTWGVVALLSFPKGIPDMLQVLSNSDRLYLSSKESWKTLLSLW